jgi:hypothetical protein
MKEGTPLYRRNNDRIDWEVDGVRRVGTSAEYREWLRLEMNAPRSEYAELDSEKPEARPDPLVNLDGKPKRKAKRKARK